VRATHSRNLHAECAQRTQEKGRQFGRYLPSGKFARRGEGIDWLPTTQNDKFIPMLRLYWPKETPPSILDGTWKPPPIEKVSAP
jgi:hypothetical protein